MIGNTRDLRQFMKVSDEYESLFDPKSHLI